jgi:hypothetical protein
MRGDMRHRVVLVGSATIVGIALAVVSTSTAMGAASPNPAFTPGATDPAVTQANISTTICRRGYTKAIRNVSRDTERKVFTEYGIPRSGQRSYVIDHLVPLEVGGSNEIKNLWPQPKNESKSKDKLESQMHTRVCKGTISVPAAQGTFLALATPAPAPTTTVPTTVPPTVPTTTSPPPPATQAPVVPSAQVVHPGAFCAPVGATGVSAAGTPMVCGPASDGRNRWRSQ